MINSYIRESKLTISLTGEHDLLFTGEPNYCIFQNPNPSFSLCNVSNWKNLAHDNIMTDQVPNSQKVLTKICYMRHCENNEVNPH